MPAFARRFVHLQVRCTPKENKKKIPFKIRIEKTLGKVDTRGKSPKGTSSSRTSNKRATRGSARRNPHATVGTHQNASEYKSGNATVAIKLEDTKDLNCVFEKPPRR